MGYAKEKKILDKLLTKAQGLATYDGKNLEMITDIYEQYSHAIRILKNKNPELFLSQYQNELEQAKGAKRILKESEEIDRHDNFLKYKESLLLALNNAINIIDQTV